MKRYRRILVPVDGSELSHDAFEQAVELAKLVGSSITVLHVIEHYIMDHTMVEGQDLIAAVNLVQTETREQARRMLKDYEDIGEKEGVEIKIAVREGPVAGEIVEMSRKYDLIIIGSHGKSRLTSFFLGSVAERVSRHAHCPVMLVRELPEEEKA
jgi:nucleotide-binding universal stress UspA family protein